MLDDKIHKESSQVYAMRHNGNDFHISLGRYDVNLANNLKITSFHGEHGVVYFLICVSQLSRLSWAKNVLTCQWFDWLQLGKVRQKVGGHSGFCSPSWDQVRTPSSCHTLPPCRHVHWNLRVTGTSRNDTSTYLYWNGHNLFVTSFWEFICDSGCPAVPRHVGRNYVPLLCGVDTDLRYYVL